MDNVITKFQTCEKHRRFEGSNMEHNCDDCDTIALQAVGHTLNRVYEKLIVTPVASNKKPGQVVAFIGKQLCFFEVDSVKPEIGVPVEVMITRCLWRRNEKGTYDFTSVMVLLLRVVTDEYELVEHRGFECRGTMCRTTASRVPFDLGFLTPGRTDIYVASNINTSYGTNKTPKRPGKVWISKKIDTLSSPRIEGLARIEDASYAHAVRV